MTDTVSRKRIEVLVGQPLVQRVIDAALDIGVKGYTVMPILSGAGAHGAWSDDQVSGALSKVMFATVTHEDRAKQLIAMLEPLLESHGIIVLVSDVQVIRGAKF
jgi:nitrogen regulatory protein PII